MTREPCRSSATAVASGPPRSGVPQQFEIVLQPPSRDDCIVLQRSTDANAATMAFHHALRQLRTQRATGELLVRSDPAHPPHVRHPVVSPQIDDGDETHD